MVNHDPSSTDEWGDAPGQVPTDAEPGTDGELTDAWTDDDGSGQKRNVLIAQVAVVVLVLIVLGVVLVVHNHKKSSNNASTDKNGLTSTTLGADGKTGSGKASWPATVSGRPPTLGKRGEKAPDVKSTAKPGVYVWSDFDGWHAWVVSGPGMPGTVTGTLTSNDAISHATLATPGTGTVTVIGDAASFTFLTSRPVTGMDFNTGFYGKRLVFTFNGASGPIDPKLIHTGSKGVSAVYPLVIDKA